MVSLQESVRWELQNTCIPNWNNIVFFLVHESYGDGVNNKVP